MSHKLVRGMILAALLAGATGRPADAAEACGQTRMPKTLANIRNQVEAKPAPSPNELRTLGDDTLTLLVPFSDCGDLQDRVWLTWVQALADRTFLMAGVETRSDWGKSAGFMYSHQSDFEAQFTAVLNQPLAPEAKAEAERGLSFVRETEAMLARAGAARPAQ